MPDMDELTASQWIGRCAERWRTVPVAALEEVAVELWRNERLRTLDPADAASLWLSPVGDR